MPTYVWKGKNRYGDTVGGERVAASKEEVGRLLQKDQITVLSVAPAKGGFAIPFLKREKVRLKDLAVYSRQLSVLIDAELPLIQSLNILAEQTRNKYFKKVITSVSEDVEAGLRGAKAVILTHSDDPDMAGYYDIPTALGAFDAETELSGRVDGDVTVTKRFKAFAA